MDFLLFNPVVLLLLRVVAVVAVVTVVDDDIGVDGFFVLWPSSRLLAAPFIACG